MHFHADHSVFFRRRQPLWVAASGIALTSVVLLVNTGARSTAVSLAGAGVGAVLLLVSRIRGHRRIESALTWAMVLVVLALLGGVALSRDSAIVVQTGTRVLCGVVWVLWLGTVVDWASLRQILLSVRVPSSVVAALDHALLHGVLTRREWARRRDAARLRLGVSRLPVASWGPLLGEGALQAFLRLERVEENAIARSRSSRDAVGVQSVRLERVDVERGGQLVLERLELTIQPGEWVLVCGPSGAGKSSLLRLLAGLDGPSGGTMMRLGTPVSPGSPLRARLDGRVALLGQNPEHHFIASTVAEDIAWGLLRRGVEPSEARRRCQVMAKALGVDHRLERPCYELSFGEQRRVALAGLLVLEPALLLLDEPTTGLDPVASHELRALVEKYAHRTGATCIWATHDLHALPSQAKRVVLMRDRKIIYDGSTAQGLSNPWLQRAGLARSVGQPQQEDANRC